MKAVGLFSLLLIAFASAGAQEKTKHELSDADRAVLQLWAAHSNPEEARVENGTLILPVERDAAVMCGFLRVYRVKRESPGSELTRPAGYTTCGPLTRFGVKKADRNGLAPTTDH